MQLKFIDSLQASSDSAGRFCSVAKSPYSEFIAEKMKVLPNALWFQKQHGC